MITEIKIDFPVTRIETDPPHIPTRAALCRKLYLPFSRTFS